MMKLIILLISIGIVTSLALHERYRIQDDRNVNDGGLLDLYLKKKWHLLKGAFQIQVGILIMLITNIFGALFFYGFLTTFHDAYINKTVLDRSVDYLGTTAATDKFLNRLFKSTKIVFALKVLLTLGFLICYICR